MEDRLKRSRKPKDGSLGDTMLSNEMNEKTKNMLMGKWEEDMHQYTPFDLFKIHNIIHKCAENGGQKVYEPER